MIERAHVAAGDAVDDHERRVAAADGTVTTDAEVAAVDVET